MKVTKLTMSDSKVRWAISMPNGKYQGEHTDDQGFKVFNSWDRKKDAEAFKNKILKDADELVNLIKNETGFSDVTHLILSTITGLGMLILTQFMN